MKNSLTYLKGNIFSSSAEVIVNPVNTFGVMGKGLAAEFKRRYPDMFRKYKAFCEQKKFSVGQLYISREVDYAVLLFPTKKHWRKPSRIEYVEAGLKKFVDTCEEKGIKSIAFPKLGCGYGGLDWNDVRPLMEKYLRELPIEIYIYLDNEQDSNSGAVVALHNDFSIAGVFAALSEFLKKNSLLEFGGENYTVTLKSKSLRFDDGEENFSADERFLEKILDEINRQKVLPVDECDIEFKLTTALLQKVGYLSNVLIQDANGEFYKGYQLNCGLIRTAEKMLRFIRGANTLTTSPTSPTLSTFWRKVGFIRETRHSPKA